MYTGYIYCASSPSNKKYYGYTISFDSRKARHKKYCDKGVKTHFYDAIRKYGWDNIKWNITEIHNNLSKNNLYKILKEREIYWIEKDKTYLREYGYNMTMGGDGRTGSPNPPETIERLKNLLRGRTTHRKGITLKEEMIQKYGEKEGLEKYKKWILKLKNAKLGKPKSEEHKEKISKSLKGNKKSSEEIERRNKTRKENGWYKNKRKKKTIICVDNKTKKEHIFTYYTELADFLEINRFMAKKIVENKESYNNFKIFTK